MPFIKTTQGPATAKNEVSPDPGQVFNKCLTPGAKKTRILSEPSRAHRIRCHLCKWPDYVSDLAYSRRGVEPAELTEAAENCEAFQVLLGLLPSRRSWEEKRLSNMNEKIIENLTILTFWLWQTKFQPTKFTMLWLNAMITNILIPTRSLAKVTHHVRSFHLLSMSGVCAYKADLNEQHCSWHWCTRWAQKLNSHLFVDVVVTVAF